MHTDNPTLVTTDPVCGMQVDEDAELRSTWQGKDYRFCSDTCRTKFDQDPQRYVAANEPPPRIGDGS